jgi:hypothetical protein
MLEVVIILGPFRVEAARCVAFIVNKASFFWFCIFVRGHVTIRHETTYISSYTVINIA